MHFKYKRSLLFLVFFKFGQKYLLGKSTIYQGRWLDHKPEGKSRRYPVEHHHLQKPFFWFGGFQRCSTAKFRDFSQFVQVDWMMISSCAFEKLKKSELPKRSHSENCKCEHVSKLQTLAETIPYCSYQKQPFQWDLGGSLILRHTHIIRDHE